MKSRILAAIIIGMSVLALMMGCASMNGSTTQPSSKRDKVPGRIYDEPHNVSVFSRISTADDRQTQDFKKSSSVTYTHIRGTMGFSSKLSLDQQEIMQLEGPPEFVRNFRTARGNVVTEWLYESKDYQIQFKDGIMVYFAPLDEQAKLVLTFGQPSKVDTRIMAGGQQKEMFWYKNTWTWRIFVNGRLVTAQ